jgi:hypothetical protein
MTTIWNLKLHAVIATEGLNPKRYIFRKIEGFRAMQEENI